MADIPLALSVPPPEAIAHVTPAPPQFEVDAVKVCFRPEYTVAEVGSMMTVQGGGGVTVTVVEPDFDCSFASLAVMVKVELLETMGAVYLAVSNPVLEIEPPLASQTTLLPEQFDGAAE